jgi:hypothetical protein
VIKIFHKSLLKHQKFQKNIYMLFFSGHGMYKKWLKFIFLLNLFYDIQDFNFDSRLCREKKVHVSVKPDPSPPRKNRLSLSGDGT